MVLHKLVGVHFAWLCCDKILGVHSGGCAFWWVCILVGCNLRGSAVTTLWVYILVGVHFGGCVFLWVCILVGVHFGGNAFWWVCILIKVQFAWLCCDNTHSFNGGPFAAGRALELVGSFCED